MIRQVAAQKFSFSRFQMPCGKPSALPDLTHEEITLAEMFGVAREDLLCCPAIDHALVDEGFAERLAVGVYRLKSFPK